MDAGHLKLLDQEENAVTHFLSSGRLRKRMVPRLVLREMVILPGPVSGIFSGFCFR